MQTAVEAVEQFIPAGLLVTVPAPAPVNATVSAEDDDDNAEKLAITLSFDVIITLHAPVPEQLPPQPAKL